MSSQWTNKYAIMRDLSMAQGCVPVDIDKTVTADQKPPTPLISEETEEEFFRHCVGGGDFCAPDLGLIKQMLDLVRDANISSDHENEEENILQISKLNPTAAEFVVQVGTEVSHAGDGAPVTLSEDKINKNVNNKRNVAVTSILENIANKPKDKTEELTSEDLTTLLKANEPLQSRTIKNSVKKVSSWLDSNKNEKVKKTPLEMDPTQMFKKKANVSPVKQAEKTTVKSPPNVSTSYKPTSQAVEYYKKYLEKSQLKSQIRDDIWSKAEREMKEIDAKRKQEAELSLLASPCSTLTVSEADLSSGSREADSTEGSPVTSSDSRIEIVKLPQHRHLLTGDCIVCQVLCENTFKETVKIRKM